MRERRYLLKEGDMVYYISDAHPLENLEGTVRQNSDIQIWIHWDKGHREREWPLDEYQYRHDDKLFWKSIVFCCSKGTV